MDVGRRSCAVEEKYCLGRDRIKLHLILRSKGLERTTIGRIQRALMNVASHW